MTDAAGPSPSTVNGAGNLGWLLTTFANRIPDISHVLAVSSDGMAIASSEGMDKDRADQLAAITSGLGSLTTGAARVMDTGRVNHALIDMDGGVLLVMAAADRCLVAVLAQPNCDLGQVAYETAILVSRVASALTPDARPEVS